ncbi:hypothetical protein KVT40_009016 [Elsinoe batatas]|uniref:Uncharacterized protein n=1 Tax=Elsinoe batatas TaxID=2601811 RepID=A0A8K0KY59_9PEZI|nr:hypothetical protein KVT40_009016 [Elsinoe batatas]
MTRLAGINEAADMSSIKTVNLSNTPQHFHDCCLAISNQLIDQLLAVLPQPPKHTLSIGCGSGLLESLLVVNGSDKVSLTGIEVSENVNKHLPGYAFDTVSGTWATYSGATQAAAWMFVYPREPRLLANYLERHVSQTLEIILWLGPRNDWAEYNEVFAGHGFTSMSLLKGNNLVAPYEMAIVVQVQ